jgi:hypothetical protein
MHSAPLGDFLIKHNVPLADWLSNQAQCLLADFRIMHNAHWLTFESIAALYWLPF